MTGENSVSRTSSQRNSPPHELPQRFGFFQGICVDDVHKNGIVADLVMGEDG